MGAVWLIFNKATLLANTVAALLTEEQDCIGMTWELPLAHCAKRLIMIDRRLGDEDQHLERFARLGLPA